MIIIGLTGSVGMGKSTVARMCRQLGLPVFDADAVVHALLAPRGKAVAAVARHWPEALKADGGIDRQRLGQTVFADPKARERIEGILHPLVRLARQRFLQHHHRARSRAVVLDIPLLFETGQDRVCDLVLVVSAPAFLQRQRVLRRPGMTVDRFRRILAAQMPDHEKRHRAGAVLWNGGRKGDTLRQLKRLLQRLPDERTLSIPRLLLHQPPARRP